MTPEEIAANSGIIQRLLTMFGATREAATAWERERREAPRGSARDTARAGIAGAAGERRTPPGPNDVEVFPGVTRAQMAEMLMDFTPDQLEAAVRNPSPERGALARAARAGIAGAAGERGMSRDDILNMTTADLEEAMRNPPPEPATLGRQPPPRNETERAVEGSMGIDYGERVPLRFGSGPGVTAGSALNPLGERIAAWGVQQDGIVGDLARRAGGLVSGLEDMGRPTVLNTALLAAGPVGRTVAPAVGAAAAATGRHIARNAAAYGLGTAGLTTVAGTAETQQPSELGTARSEETRRRGRITTLETEDGDLVARWGLFDNLVDPSGIRDRAERERAAARVSAAQAALNIRQDGALGIETRTAIANERKRITDERARVSVDLTKARADLETQEGVVRRISDDERARGARAGPWQQAAREFGPWFAAALGAYVGHRTRTGAVSRANELTERNVAGANALLTPGPLMPGRSAAARADTMGRAANMNEFWSRGGAGEAVPFSPAQTARGFRGRPGAAEAATLFPPDTRRFRGQDFGHIGAGLGEAGLSAGGWYLAQQELAAAQAAVDRDRSEINLARLERAHDMAAVAQAFMRAGLGYAGGRRGGAFTHPYSNARPNISGAEGERMILNQLLTPANRRRR